MAQQKNTYTGRFGEGKDSKSTQAAAPAHKSAAKGDDVRRPSGFSSAGQKSRHKPAPETKAAEKPEKQRKTRRERPARSSKKKPAGRQALQVILAIILLGLLLIIIFGNRGTYHQMPTITRREPDPTQEAADTAADTAPAGEVSFNPENTPLPGVEEAI